MFFSAGCCMRTFCFGQFLVDLVRFMAFLGRPWQFVVKKHEFEKACTINKTRLSNRALRTDPKDS